MNKKVTITTANGEEEEITGPNVGELLIHYLKLEGVTHVFGVPGGGLMHFLVNLKDSYRPNAPNTGIQYVIARHETGAAYMADGYYRATGKLGVVIVTTGPGATNALTGVMNAQADGSALLLITGEIDQQFNGKGYLQEGVDAPLDIKAIYTASTCYSANITTANNANTITKQALRGILSLPRSAGHLSLPVNVTIENTAEGTKLADETTDYRTEHKGAPLSETKKAFKSLLACKRPLIFLGNGSRQAMREKHTSDIFKTFVENFAIPVITTADAKGIFPESHDMSLRVYGMADCMWPYYYLTAGESEGEVPYDGILVIGSALGELSTNKWLEILKPNGKDAPFIQVDINQKIIGRSFEVSHGIVGEARAFIHDMAHMSELVPIHIEKISNRKEFINKIKKDYSPFFDPTGYKSNASPVQPAGLMRTLQETMPANTKIFVDAGNCVGWAVHYLEMMQPMEIFTSLSMGPMGFAVGAVVGAKIGCPKATCIGFVGDGAFMMQGSEISAAKQNNIGAIWIVLFDNNLSMVSQGMEHYAADETDPGIWKKLYELGNPDLVKYSEGLGAQAYTVNSPNDMYEVMPKVLKGANEDNIPQVIVVNVDREAIPPYYNDMYAPPA